MESYKENYVLRNQMDVLSQSEEYAKDVMSQQMPQNDAVSVTEDDDAASTA